MTNGRAERIPDYIEHIISAISQIEIIGEAARRLMSADPEFPKKFPALELEAAYRMRNALAHGYEAVNLRTVWDTIEQNLPSLKAAATSVLTMHTKP